MLLSWGNSHHLAFQKEVQNRGSGWRYCVLNQEKRWAKEGACEVLMDKSHRGLSHALRDISIMQPSVLQGGIFKAQTGWQKGNHHPWHVSEVIFQGSFSRGTLPLSAQDVVSHFSCIALQSGVATRGAECRPWGASAISRCRCWQMQAGC